MKTKTKDKLTKDQKFGVTVGMLLFVIKGLRNGSIKSKPIMNIEEGVKEYGMTSLEDEIWAALEKCGIKEKKP